MAHQRGVRQSPCYIFNFFTILFHDVSKTTYKNFGGLGSVQFLVCFLSYLVNIYYQQNLNIARGLGYHPHNDWTIYRLITEE